VLQEKNTYEEDVLSEESKYHQLHSLQLLFRAEVAAGMYLEQHSIVTSAFIHYVFIPRTVANCTAAHERDEHGETLKDKYSKVIQEQEQLSRTLREQQKMIKVRAAHWGVLYLLYMQDNTVPNQQQLEMFNDVKKILSFKLKLHSNSSDATGSPLQVCTALRVTCQHVYVQSEESGSANRLIL
jgi:hypothetical protein